MNDVLKQWFKAHAGAPEILGAGVRLPDGHSFCHSNNENFPAAKIENILQQFAADQTNLFEPDLAPRWSTWIFEQGKLRFVPRADGLLLGLVAHAETDIVQKLDRISAEFLALTFS